MKGNELHIEKVIGGLRSYFIDIKKSTKGDYYLKIAESKRIENGEYESHQILIFNEDIDRFAEAFGKTMTELEEIRTGKSKEEKTTKNKAYSIEKIRKTHNAAYKRWTKEEDDKLELLFCEGKEVKELATIFGRNEGAINSRIIKLELNEKYNS